eukprot:16445666-Heterocapsa_arctica.AAC.1
MDGGDLTASQITGEQKEDADPKSVDCSGVGQIIENERHKYHIDHKVDSNNKDMYPGVSSQKRFKLKTEQLFKEGQADKAINKQEALQTKQRKKAEKEQRFLE